MVAILKVGLTNGFKSTEFYQCYDQHLNYLKLEPAAENPCPSWMVSLRFERQVSCTNGEQFWKMLLPGCLIGHGFDKGDVGATQLRLAAQRLLSAVHHESKQNEPNIVAALRVFWVPKDLVDELQNKELMQSIAHLQVLCEHTACEVDETSIAKLEAAVDVVQSETPPQIFESLKMLPAGHVLIKSARACAIKLRAFIVMDTQFAKLVSDLDKKLVDSPWTTEVQIGLVVTGIQAIEEWLAKQPLSFWDYAEQFATAETFVKMKSATGETLAKAIEALLTRACVANECKDILMGEPVNRVRGLVEAFDRATRMQRLFEVNEGLKDFFPTMEACHVLLYRFEEMRTAVAVPEDFTWEGVEAYVSDLTAAQQAQPHFIALWGEKATAQVFQCFSTYLREGEPNVHSTLAQNIEKQLGPLMETINNAFSLGACKSECACSCA